MGGTREGKGREEMKWWPGARGQRDSAVAMDGLMNTIRLEWFPAQRADTSRSSAAGIHPSESASSSTTQKFTRTNIPAQHSQYFLAL